MSELNENEELEIQKIEAENLILRMLESPIHCDETGGIKIDYLIENLQIYLDWDKKQSNEIINELKDEKIILQIKKNHVCLNFSYIYFNDCEKDPNECASAMWNKHRNKSIENSLRVKEAKLSFLKGLEDEELAKIINRMLGIVEDSEITHKIELEYPTKHLQGYENLSLATGVIGKEYRVIKKSVWYSILSTKISESELRLGRIKTDGRFSILIVLGSGKGKGEFKSVIKEVMKKIKINKHSDNGKSYESMVKCEELTVYHPDQFIGKVKVRTYKNDRIPEPIEGFLALDYLILDESRELLTSKEAAYTESRRALRLGADGKEIYKKNVDARLDEGLKYVSKCVFCIFVQPKSLDADFVLDGDARRFAIAYVNHHGVNQDEARRKNITDPEVDEKALIEEIIEKFNQMEVPGKFTVADEAKKTFEELYELLYQRGMTYSHKIADFTEINQFTIPNMLLKMSAIQALQLGSNIINSKDIELAFIDYVEILEHTYEYIETRVLGSLNYQEKWQGATGKHQEVLRWLNDEGATSRESSEVSIADYKQKIKESFNVKDRQAANIIQNHRSQGWIESTQAQNNSKLWITFTPDTRGARVAGMQPGAYKKLQNKYYEILNKYFLKYEENNFPELHSCNPCTPEDMEILEDALKKLKLKTHEKNKELKSLEYIKKAYENDIESMKCENEELTDKNGEKSSELVKNIEIYSKGLKKLNKKLDRPIAVVNQQFTLIERSSERLKEALYVEEG